MAEKEELTHEQLCAEIEQWIVDNWCFSYCSLVMHYKDDPEKARCVRSESQHFVMFMDSFLEDMTIEGDEESEETDGTIA